MSTQWPERPGRQDHTHNLSGTGELTLNTSMTVFSARVLYAKQVARKRKTWQDGFLCVIGQDQSKRSATLYDESGVVVSSARISASPILNADSEGISVSLVEPAGSQMPAGSPIISAVSQTFASSRAGLLLWTRNVTLRNFLRPQDARQKGPRTQPSEKLRTNQHATLKYSSLAGRSLSFTCQKLKAH